MEHPRRSPGVVVALVAGVVLLVLTAWAVVDKQLAGGTVPHAAPSGTGILVSPTSTRAEAPLLVVYFDYMCEPCKRYHDVFRDRVERAVESGRIRLEFRTLTFMDVKEIQGSTNAAIGAACADGLGSYRDYDDAVWAQQDEIGGTWRSTQILRTDIPTAIGLGAGEIATFQRCFDAHATSTFVKSVNQRALSSGMNRVPAWLLDGVDITSKLDPKEPSSIDPFIGA